MVREKSSGTRFKCDALVDAACGPLQKLLDGKKYLLSDDHPSSLDCLALAYLALALKPELPQNWLQEGIKTRYPSLCAYVERGVQACFGDEVSVQDALLTEPMEQTSDMTRTKLPWKAPSQQGLQAAGYTVLHSILSAVPISYPNPLTPFPTTTTSNEKSNSSTTTTTNSPLLPPIIAASTAVAAAAAGYLLYAFSISKSEPEPEKRRKLEDMGEAGAVFAGLDFGG